MQVIFNSPHNPSGHVATEAELQLVSELCCKHDAIAISDEVQRCFYRIDVFALPTCLAAWLPGCLAVWLPGCLAAYLPTCLPAWQPGWLPACLPTCLAGWLPA